MDTNKECVQRIWKRAALRDMLKLTTGLTLGTGFCLLGIFPASAAEMAAGRVQGTLPPLSQIFTFFFLMLGPIKIIGPFARMTQGTDTRFARHLALRAAGVSSLALLLAALLGETFLANYSIPLPVLEVTGGVILFLVALQTSLQQFNPPTPKEVVSSTPPLGMAMMSLAFPTIVTPYGIAALIIFIALSPDMGTTLAIGGLVLLIMILDIIAMLLSRHILRFLGLFLQILGAVLGIIQVALGLQIIIRNLKILFS